MAKRKTSGGGKHKVVWTDRALQDLRDIDEYIAADDPAAAERWINKLTAATERAGMLPASGQLVRELERDDIRQALVKTYRIIYRIRTKQIDVLTVFEGHRLLPDDVQTD